MGTAGATATSRSFIVTTGGTTTAASAVVPSASNSAPTSRQNLDSIVEAIRHLEGDHLFSEDSHKVVKEEVWSTAPLFKFRRPIFLLLLSITMSRLQKI